MFQSEGKFGTPSLNDKVIYDGKWYMVLRTAIGQNGNSPYSVVVVDMEEKENAKIIFDGANEEWDRSDAGDLNEVDGTMQNQFVEVSTYGGGSFAEWDIVDYDPVLVPSPADRARELSESANLPEDERDVFSHDDYQPVRLLMEENNGLMIGAPIISITLRFTLLMAARYGRCSCPEESEHSLPSISIILEKKNGY